MIFGEGGGTDGREGTIAAPGANDEFMHAGGQKFSHIPCLNDSGPGMAMLEALVRRELAGWL